VKFAFAASLLLVGPSAADGANSPPNPLVGTWQLEQYVDVPEGGAPVYEFGKQPMGLFVFTPDGHVSISIMRNPPALDAKSSDPNPDACIPAWYCSYFGTYRYDPDGPSWTTHVLGGNIPRYFGTDQPRRFKINGDVLTISDTFSANGKTFRATRVLRRLDR
jgi:lipocalin-like protein